MGNGINFLLQIHTHVVYYPQARCKQTASKKTDILAKTKEIYLFC